MDSVIWVRDGKVKKMTELINGRTPEEIKLALEWATCACGNLVCEECQYYESVCSHENFERIAPDALALIEHLEGKRDALLKEVHGDCGKCKHYNKAAYVEPCKSCRKSSGREGFEWRGFKPTKEDEK